MKTLLNWMLRLLWLVPLLPASGAVSFYDGFDDPLYYGPGTNFLTPIRGWSAGSTNVQVTASVCDTAPNSVQIVETATLTNTVGGVGGQVWTECRVRPTFGDMPPDLTANGGASLAVYFTGSRCLAVATNGGWLVCSNTIWGGALPALPDGQFVRVTVYQNYATSNSAVFVNSNLVAQDLGYRGTNAGFGAFLARGGELYTTSYVDTVSFSNGPPADILADLNGDGVRDVDELAWYGYAMRQLTVATNGTYTNLQTAVNAARARDLIVVSNGTYAGDVYVDHAVRFGAGSFTNNGGFTVATGATVSLLATAVFNSASVSGTVTLATSAVLNVTASLDMGGTGLIQSTGGVLAVASPYASLSGTFTVNGSDWMNTLAQPTLPFYDGFELYGAGTPLASYAFRGWGASTTNTQVQTSTVAVGTRAVTVAGSEMASNRVNGAGQRQVWTDLRLRAKLGVTPWNPATNQSTCLIYFDTNGYVVVYNRTNGWNTCSTNAAGTPVTNRVTESRWARVTIYMDFKDRQSVVFLDSELLREGVPFGMNAATNYNRFAVDNAAITPTYMDEVSVGPLPPPDLYGDIDGDGQNDFTEIARHGTINYKPPGTVFKIR